MSTPFKSFLIKPLIVTAMLGTGFVQAQTDPAAPTREKATDHNTYVGVGLFSDMLNLNTEFVTDWGNFMVRGGRFKRVNEGFAMNMSWRRPLELSDDVEMDGNASGYYMGLFAGQLASEMLANEHIQRVGAGAEMGYHWVRDYTRAEFTVGLGMMKKEEKSGVKLGADPTIFFSFNIALGY